MSRTAWPRARAVAPASCNLCAVHCTGGFAGMHHMRDAPPDPIHAIFQHMFGILGPIAGELCDGVTGLTRDMTQLREVLGPQMGHSTADLGVQQHAHGEEWAQMTRHRIAQLLHCLPSRLGIVREAFGVLLCCINGNCQKSACSLAITGCSGLPVRPVKPCCGWVREVFKGEQSMQPSACAHAKCRFLHMAAWRIAAWHSRMAVLHRDGCRACTCRLPGEHHAHARAVAIRGQEPHG